MQVSSVNRKGLDLTVRLPGDWDGLEPAVAERVRKVAARGKVHVQVELEGPAGRAEATWNEPAVHAALDQLAALAQARGLAFAPTPELLWQVAQKPAHHGQAARGRDLCGARPRDPRAGAGAVFRHARAGGRGPPGRLPRALRAPAGPDRGRGRPRP